MTLQRLPSSLAFFATFALANSASAEVLDKLEFPWGPEHFVRMLVVLICTSMLAASTRVYVRVAGLVAAILWAAFSLWADPYFENDIGNALRAELSTAQSAMWLNTILLQALAPLFVTLIVFLWRSRNESRKTLEMPKST